MAIEEHETEGWFHEGRGNGVKAKSGLTEGEVEVKGLEETPGAEHNDSGAKSTYATGEMPFHRGAGEGRGHGTEDK